MGTANYNFTYIDPNKTQDVPGDTKVFLDEIDGKMHEQNLAETSRINTLKAKFPVSTADLADKSVTADKLADGAVTLESLGIAPNTLDGNVIRDGSIGATKLSSTGVDALLAGIEIRHFNSTDAAADNEGMDIIEGMDLEGWYIPIWGLVVISRFMRGWNKGAWPTVPNSEGGRDKVGIKLPSYVPKPTKNINVGYAIRFIDNPDDTSNNTDFSSWSGAYYSKDGRLEFATQNDTDGYITGTIAFFVQSDNNAASKTAYIESNGVL